MIKSPIRSIFHHFGLLIMLVALGLLGGLVPTVAAQAAPRPAQDSVTLSVDKVTPLVPTPSDKPRTLTFKLTVTNTSNNTLRNVELSLVRDAPITTQAGLNAAMAGHRDDFGELPIQPRHPGQGFDLAPGDAHTTTFTTTTSKSDDGEGLCLCNPAGIYPLRFTAHGTNPDGVEQPLGTVTTYLPTSYRQHPGQVRVSWVWPLLEHPHRVVEPTVFTDDLLAASVAPGGRLYRALEVVAELPDNFPLTLVIDPELLDELRVMTGTYTVEQGAGEVPGAGQAVASAWLDQLVAVLDSHPNVTVALTPYGNPDVEALTQNNLDWSSVLPASMSLDVAAALGGHTPTTTFAWPASTTLSRTALTALAESGTRTVLLGTRAVAPAADRLGAPLGATRLKAAGTELTALLTSPALQKAAARAVTDGAAGVSALPTLLAQLSVRVAQSPDTTHRAVLTPPAYVDPDVDAAVTAITASSTSLFTRPVTIAQQAAADDVPLARLRKAPPSAAQLPKQLTDTIAALRSARPVLAGLLVPTNPAAQTLLTNLPIALQRLESSAWPGQHASETALRQAASLLQTVTTIKTGVKIVRPSSGSYTLASSNSPLPITVENDLDYPVRVTVDVHTENSLPGFTAKPVSQQIEAHSKRTVHVPTDVERSGRIRVEAQLLTADGAQLGAAVPLSVHSTALGVVGIVITVVAGAVLALALVLRLGRRLYKRSRRVGPDQAENTDPTVSPSPETTSS